MERVNLELPAPLLEAVDEARGDVPRNPWIRRAIEDRLRQEERFAELTKRDRAKKPNT